MKNFNIHELKTLVALVQGARKKANSFDEYIKLTEGIVWKGIITEQEWRRLRTLNSPKLI